MKNCYVGNKSELLSTNPNGSKEPNGWLKQQQWDHPQEKSPWELITSVGSIRKSWSTLDEDAAE